MATWNGLSDNRTSDIERGLKMAGFNLIKDYYLETDGESFILRKGNGDPKDYKYTRYDTLKDLVKGLRKKLMIRAIQTCIDRADLEEQLSCIDYECNRMFETSCKNW